MSTKRIHATAAHITTTIVKPLALSRGIPIAELLSPQITAYCTRLFYDNVINNQGLQQLINYCSEAAYTISTDDVDKAIDILGIRQVSDETAIQAIIDTVIRENDVQVQQYKSGKVQVIGFLVGKCMKLSSNSIDPALCKQLLEKTLSR